MQVKSLTAKERQKANKTLIIKSGVPFFILIKEIKVAMWQLKSEVDYEIVPV